LTSELNRETRILVRGKYIEQWIKFSYDDGENVKSRQKLHRKIASPALAFFNFRDTDDHLF
jgi:hypothetical protein